MEIYRFWRRIRIQRSRLPLYVNFEPNAWWFIWFSRSPKSAIFGFQGRYPGKSPEKISLWNHQWNSISTTFAQLRWPKLPKPALNFSWMPTQLIRTRKKCWNWILKKNRKFDPWDHRISLLGPSQYKTPIYGGPKISNFQKYRATVRESS